MSVQFDYIEFVEKTRRFVISFEIKIIKHLLDKY